MILGLEPANLALVFAGFAIAGFAKGVTGLGFSTTCLPFLVLAAGLETALAVVLVPSITSNLIVMRSAGGIQQTFRRFLPVYLAMPLGILLGLWILTTWQATVGTAVLGLVLILYACFGLARPNWRLDPELGRVLRFPVGLTTGTVNGLTGSQLIPVMPYLLSLDLAPAIFVTAINIGFTVSSLTMAAGLGSLGILTWQTGAISVLGLIPMYAAVNLGSRLRDRLAPELFRKVVLLTLMALGLLILARSLY